MHENRADKSASQLEPDLFRRFQNAFPCAETAQTYNLRVSGYDRSISVVADPRSGISIRNGSAQATSIDNDGQIVGEEHLPVALGQILTAREERAAHNAHVFSLAGAVYRSKI